MGRVPICGMKSSLETKERVETIAFTKNPNRPIQKVEKGDGLDSGHNINKEKGEGERIYSGNSTAA